jgi:hypothetical protein
MSWCNLQIEPLRDPRRFAQLYRDCELATIAWDHGVDFAFGYLYEKLATVALMDARYEACRNE